MTDRILTAFVVAVLAALAFAAWRVADAPVRTISVSGELSASERQKIARLVSGIDLGGILGSDLDAVREVLASLGWAHEVAVRRAWPGRLVVSVARLEPVARWAGGGYISADGELLQLPDEHPGLPAFDIALSSPAEAMEVFRLVDQIAAREGMSVAELVENGQGEWQVTLNGGTTIRLGSEGLNERMHRFLHAYRGALHGEARRIEYVDARYASGVAVRFADAPAAASLHRTDVDENGG